jgi:mannosyltransferase OCH1-like enzyme
MIPKKIHYCWFGPKPLSKLVVNCLETWSQQLPDYTLCLWNENNSPMQVPFVQQAYNAKKFAFVSDFVRFWALYQQGGVYLDTDMFVIRSFDDLLQKEVFFAWETDQKKVISCGVIGAVPKQPFIGDVINHYESLHFNISSIPDFVIPRIVSKCFNDYSTKKEITIFPFDYFYPFPYEDKENIHNFRRYITGNTYAIHLWNVSWGTSIAKLRDRIFYYYRKVRVYFTK